MDLVALDFYKIIYPYRESHDPTLFFSRIKREIIDERIYYLRAFNLLDFYGGEGAIRTSLAKNIETPVDIENENELTDKIVLAMDHFRAIFNANAYDLKPIIGFLKGKPLELATFLSLEKELSSLVKSGPSYVLSTISKNIYSLLTDEFTELTSYKDVPELVSFVKKPENTGLIYNAIHGLDSDRAKVIDDYLLTRCGYITKTQVDLIFNEVLSASLKTEMSNKKRSNLFGFLGFLASSIVYFFAFFFLSLLATYWGYAQFGKITSSILYGDTFYNQINFDTALFGMIFILPLFYLATIFGTYERRKNRVNSNLLYQLSPRIVPALTLVLHAIFLFNLTDKGPDNVTNIFERVFYLGENGYYLGAIYIIIAIMTFIMDLYSFSNVDDFHYWNAQGKPGRSWLTQNGPLYVIPFIFALRLFMPSMHVNIMIGLTVLVFFFALLIPLVCYIFRINNYYFSIIPVAILLAMMIIVYLLMTKINVLDIVDTSTDGWWIPVSFFIVILSSIGIFIGFVFIGRIDNIYIRFISPMFITAIIGTILLCFINTDSTELAPNIYNYGQSNAYITPLIIIFGIVSIIEEFAIFHRGVSDGFIGSNLANLSLLLILILHYVFTPLLVDGLWHVSLIGSAIVLVVADIYRIIDARSRAY